MGASLAGERKIVWCVLGFAASLGVVLALAPLPAAAQILDPPAEYPYAPGYFAVYFADPDGLKFEFAFVPGA